MEDGSQNPEFGWNGRVNRTWLGTEMRTSDVERVASQPLCLWHGLHVSHNVSLLNCAVGNGFHRHTIRLNKYLLWPRRCWSVGAKSATKLKQLSHRSRIRMTKPTNCLRKDNNAFSKFKNHKRRPLGCARVQVTVRSWDAQCGSRAAYGAVTCHVQVIS